MRRWLAVCAVALVACGGGGDDEGGPEAAMVEYVDAIYKQQGGRTYEMIVPEQASVIDRDLYIRCVQDESFPEVDIEATDSYRETIDVPEVGEVETWAVTVELSRGEVRQSVTRHLIERDGEYYRFFDAADLETYASGECP